MEVGLRRLSREGEVGKGSVSKTFPKEDTEEQRPIMVAESVAERE